MPKYAVRRDREPSHKLRYVVASIVVMALAFASIVFYRWLTEKPKPTVVGWQAVVSTVAGDGALGFKDGKGANARFADLFGIAVDSTGNVFVAEAGDNNRIRKITPQGDVTTFAGGTEGLKDGQGTNASFNTPSAMAIDAANNLYVADTGNNTIRKITPTGMVETIAGDGSAGYRDGPAHSAQFNGPIGVAVDKQGNVYVADTYNDRIRQITTDGQVKTIAGGSTPGYQDGPANSALFDTPCGVAVGLNGDLFIADTGNSFIRKLTKDGQVSTFVGNSVDGMINAPLLRSPIGLVSTFDGFLYVTDRRSVFQVSPDGAPRLLAGDLIGFANGAGAKARFNYPTGIALDHRGALYVSDASNYIIRKLDALENGKTAPVETGTEVLPKLNTDTLNITSFPWPVAPQHEWHEIAGTMGEDRGSYDGEPRDHFHSGVDVVAPLGTPVLSVYDEKVVTPLSNIGFESLNEGVHVGIMTYFHVRVGRNAQDEMLDTRRFIAVRDDQGKITRVRVRRGTRFRVGDTLGTINKMYHVHLNFGPSGAEINPFNLPFIGFTDKVPPTIESDGIKLVNTSGERLKQQSKGRLLVSGDVGIVVDAYDQVDGNQTRRRLGIYRLGYQVLHPDGSPAPGFDSPRMTMEFNRLPADRDAVKVAYADSSGITVYGNAATKFLYMVTNTIKDGKTERGIWHASELPKGDYTLRIFAYDFAGNEATKGRDLPITIN